jgi:hypothetical protein
MPDLYIAAGGGGDAVGVLLLRQLLGAEPSPPIVTVAWERLRIDPEPGPRSRAGFVGLAAVDGETAEVTATTDTVPAGRSSLPRLAASTGARLFVVDLDHGAAGLASQLQHLATVLDATRLVVVDIGGDILATGHEPGLRSPLADGLTLAAAHLTDLPTRLVVAGPGLDAELSAVDVTARLHAVRAEHLGYVTPADVEPVTDILAWHPTEASMLLAAAALGVRGRVDMRRGDRPVALDQESAAAWSADVTNLDRYPIANVVADSHTLADARLALAPFAADEIEYERTKARASALAPTPLSIADTLDHVSEHARASLTRGATLMTTRRLLETLNVPQPLAADLVDQLGSRTPRERGMLWRLDDLARLG